MRSPTGKTNMSVLQGVQTGCGDHPTSYSFDTGALSQRIKRPGCKNKHSRLSRRLNAPTKQLVLYQWRQNTLDMFSVPTACVQKSLGLPDISTSVPYCAASVIKKLISQGILETCDTARSHQRNSLAYLITTN